MRQRSRFEMDFEEKERKGEFGRKRKIPRFLVVLAALALILNAFIVMTAVNVAAEGGSPRVWTDKPDYRPEETVVIDGENFTANDPVEVKITRPDGEEEYTNTTADGSGSFTTNYSLDGILGKYLVEATDDHGLYSYCTFTDGKPPSLFGWDWKFDDWTKSTLEGWGAGDWVWWHVKIYNAQPATYKLVWNHDYYNKLLDTFGFVEIRDVRVLYDDYPNENETGISVTVDDPWYREESNTVLIEFNATFTIATAGDYYLRWDARIDENETKPWPGKALHTHFKEWYVDGDYNNAGNQDVQVEQPLSPPLSTINGYKYWDKDEDGVWDAGEPGLANWTMHLTGEDIHGKIVDRYRTTGEDGYYQFAGIVEGLYNVSEELKEGWKCTNRSGDPPATGIINITSEGTNLTHIDFGNAHLTPDIQVTKTGDVTEAHEGDTVTYTVVVTNIGEVTLYDVYIYDDLLDDYYYKEVETGSDELAVDDTWTIIYDYTISSGDDDPLVNTVTANGTDIFGTNVSDQDSWSVDVLHPGINIVKTGPEEAHEGDTVTYTFTVTNTGDCPLKEVGVTDDKAGTATYVSGDTDSDTWLDTTETWIFTADYTIPTPSGDLTNTATASGKDNLDQEVTDTDDHTLDVLHPGINIVKTGPAEAHEGDTVTYTFTVTNTGDCPLKEVGVTDNKAGTATYVSGDTDSDNWLDLVETWTFTADYTIPTPSGDVTNTATASGKDNLNREVTDTDDHTLDVLHPGINVVKTGPAEAHEGDTVTYTFTVTNTGDSPLKEVGVTDNKAGTATYVSGDTDSDNWLDLDETWTFTADYTIPTPSDDVTNTGTASGTDNLDQEVTDTDDHTLDVLHPDINVVKTGPAEAHEGDTVTYTFTVTNTGDCPLQDVGVTDDKAGTATYVSGDTDSDNWLDLDETWIFTADYTIPTPSEDVTNTGTASGTDNLDLEVTDTDDHTLDVLHPGIQIVKAGPEEAHEGDTVTYTFTVTNTGDCPLKDVGVTDDKAGTATYVSGDADSDNWLDLDETWIFTADYTIPTPSDDVTNTGTASGTDNLDQEVTDTDDHTIDVLHPGIQVVKTGPAEAHEGDTVTYTFTVTNTGDCPLTDVSVTDDQAGTATYVSGDTDSDNWLDLDETWIFTADYTIPTPSDDVTNTGTASGEDNLGEETTDTDDHTLDVLHPGINVVKTGPAEAHEGDTVTYTFTVTNTGDCPLKDVGVTDNKAGTATYVSGDTDSDNWLDLDETWTFTADYTIPTPSEDVTNTGTASGKDNLNREVTDTDDHTVDVLHPGIQIVKTGPAEAHEGDTVTYTFTVTNTGDCPLTDVSVTDDKAGTATYVSGDTDSDNWLDLDETWTFTADYTIPTPSEDVTNTGTASGTDNLDQEVTDTDDHTIDVLHPGIQIVKTGPAEAHEGDTVTYTFTVTNTGDCPLKEVGVTDDKAGTATYVSGDTDSDTWLDLDETWIFTADYTISTPSDDFTNTATASGKDNLNREVTDTDDHTLDVLHPGINIVKTGPAEAHEGDTVTYTFTVTNTGDCPLKDVGVTDNKAGTATYVSGDTDSDNWLDLDETWIFTADYTISVGETDPLVNIATASGTDNIGRTVTDTDTWTIDILHPAIDVTKSADKEYAYWGEPVTYTFTVSNIGDCTLYDVTVIDTIFGDLTAHLPDDTLDVGESNTFQIVYIVPATYENIINVVTVTGTDNLGETVTDSDGWTVIVISLTKSEVTDTSFCHFDRNPDRDGQQFRLIFTQDPTDPGTYKLTASNPGQYYYNVFYIGSEGETVTLQVTIPYPFVTQGAVPIHVWSGVSYDEDECYIPADSIGGFTVSGTDTQTPSGQLGIALEDHVDGSVTITITGQVPASHLFYVTVHLDYGLKGSVGYGKNYNNDAIDPDTLEVLIPNYNEYVFSVSGDMEDTQVVENENTFKRNPGFGGIVTDEFGNPIEGYTVKVYDADGNLIGSALTDEDGYYFIYYKHRGRRSMFTVAVYENPNDPDPLAIQVVELKANKFVEVNFVI